MGKRQKRSSGGSQPGSNSDTPGYRYGSGPSKRPPWSSDFRRTVSSPAAGASENRRYNTPSPQEPDIPEEERIVVKRTPEELVADARMEELVEENAFALEEFEVDVSEASTLTPGGGSRPKTLEEVKEILRAKTDALKEDEWMYTPGDRVRPKSPKVLNDPIHKGL